MPPFDAGASWAASVEEEDIISEIAARQPLGLDAVLKLAETWKRLTRQSNWSSPVAKLFRSGFHCRRESLTG